MCPHVDALVAWPGVISNWLSCRGTLPAMCRLTAVRATGGLVSSSHHSRRRHISRHQMMSLTVKVPGHAIRDAVPIQLPVAAIVDYIYMCIYVCIVCIANQDGKAGEWLDGGVGCGVRALYSALYLIAAHYSGWCAWAPIYGITRVVFSLASLTIDIIPALFDALLVYLSSDT